MPEPRWAVVELGWSTIGNGRLHRMGRPPRRAVRTRLRDATQGLHERLHQLPPFVALAQGRIDQAGYMALLIKLYGFHRPLERLLQATAHHGHTYGLDVGLYTRAPLIEADLLHLGLDPLYVARIPSCPLLPESESVGHLLGCLYVLEGSRFGGRHLARGLDHLLGPDTRAGRRFLGGNDDSPDKRWHLCCSAIERYGASDGARVAEMVAAASDTFRCLEEWLAGATDER